MEKFIANAKQEETLEDTIAQKIRFQMDIVATDFENNVETSMKVFYKVLENLLFEAEKEQQERSYSEEEVQVKLYECLGHFAQKHNIVINGNEIDQWFNKFKKK